MFAIFLPDDFAGSSVPIVVSTSCLFYGNFRLLDQDKITLAHVSIDLILWGQSISSSGAGFPGRAGVATARGSFRGLWGGTSWGVKQQKWSCLSGFN